MLRTSLVSMLLAAVGACATNGGGGDGMSGGSRPDMTNGVSTLAGWADAGYQDGDRNVNLFHNPTNVAYGPDGNLYVADFDNNKLRMVDADGNAVTIINEKSFQRPFGLAFSPDGSLYVSTDNDENGGHTLMSGAVWKVDVHAKTATLLVSKIGRPRGLFVLKDGNLAAADYMHHVVEKIDTRTGAVSVIAGTFDMKGFADGVGAAALFAQPYFVVQRADGNLIVSDFENNKLRVVGLDGTVSTLAGGGAGFADGSMANAQFNQPQALALASNGDIYLTDLGNNRVRRISGTSIETIAGDGTSGYADDDDCMAAEFQGLEGLSVKPDGSMVYVADGTRGTDIASNRVRTIKMP